MPKDLFGNVSQALGFVLSGLIAGNLAIKTRRCLRWAVAVLMFLQNAIVLDAQLLPLFRVTAIKLAEQLQMATDLSPWFNELAGGVGAAEIDL